MAKAQSDKFSNFAVVTCIESAANTLTFKKLETGIPLFEKMAWLISRIEWFWNDLSAAQLNATGDYVTCALTVTNALATVTFENSAVIELVQVRRYDYGAAASGDLKSFPMVRDFSTLPGGGLIVAPNPLYVGVVGSGCVAANAVLAKLWYTNYQLSTEEYWELVESRRTIVS